MFFKKNNSNPYPLFDAYIEMHDNKLAPLSFAINKCVRQVITMNEVINLYPDGIRKIIEEQRAREAKEALVETLNKYEEIRKEIVTFYNENKEKIGKIALPTEGHLLVERYYQTHRKL